MIRGDALVDRVVFEGRAGGAAGAGAGAAVAVGVRVRLDGEWTTIEAGEVVLCAGAVHSPAIALRSGIGPGGAVADLPVGRHLQDHPLCMLIVPLLPDARPQTIFDRHTNVCVRYSSQLAGAGRNDMMLVAMNSAPAAPVGLLGAWVGECFSEGELTLASNDPTVDPVIDERMLEDERDRGRMRDGVRRLLELAASQAVRGIATGPLTGVLPPPGPGAPDGEIDNWALRTAMDAQHICSTARMGADDDPSAVVGAQCRVRGVARLGIVDASIFPRVPRANTHLAGSGRGGAGCGNLPTGVAAEQVLDGGTAGRRDCRRARPGGGRTTLFGSRSVVDAYSVVVLTRRSPHPSRRHHQCVQVPSASPPACSRSASGRSRWRHAARRRQRRTPQPTRRRQRRPQ